VEKVKAGLKVLTEARLQFGHLGRSGSGFQPMCRALSRDRMKVCWIVREEDVTWAQAVLVSLLS
jgi:hypothetical protein